MNEFRSNFSETRGKHRVAFVQSCWHRDIVDEMRDAFTETFQGLDTRSIDYVEVPGAFEIPLKAKILALTNKIHMLNTGSTFASCTKIFCTTSGNTKPLIPLIYILSKAKP